MCNSLTYSDNYDLSCVMVQILRKDLIQEEISDETDIKGPQRKISLARAQFAWRKSRMERRPIRPIQPIPEVIFVLPLFFSDFFS